MVPFDASGVEPPITSWLCILVFLSILAIITSLNGFITNLLNMALLQPLEKPKLKATTLTSSITWQTIWMTSISSGPLEGWETRAFPWTARCNCWSICFLTANRQIIVYWLLTISSFMTTLVLAILLKLPIVLHVSLDSKYRIKYLTIWMKCIHLLCNPGICLILIFLTWILSVSLLASLDKIALTISTWKPLYDLWETSPAALCRLLAIDW